MLLLLASILWAIPSHESIQKTISSFNTLSDTKIPTLNEKQRQKLLKGEVVSLVQKGGSDGGQVSAGKAVAFYISDLPKEQLWISFQDPHFQVQESTIEALYKSNGTDKLEWYGYIDLPWPLTDRHWLVRVWNNHKMAEESNNAMWEHPWRLIPEGKTLCADMVAQGKVQKVSTSNYNSAIYLPDSQGVWAMMDMEGSTLLAYSATATVGGAIPESLMMKYLLSGLDSFMKDGEKRAREVVPQHYKASHEPIYGGDGIPVKTY